MSLTFDRILGDVVPVWEEPVERAKTVICRHVSLALRSYRDDRAIAMHRRERRILMGRVFSNVNNKNEIDIQFVVFFGHNPL